MQRVFVLAVFLVPAAVHAADVSATQPFTFKQEHEQTVEESIPASAFKPDQNEFLTFSLENDSWAGGTTDRNYTNGIRISYFNLENQPPDIAYWLDKYVPFFDVNATTGVTYTVGQNIYTPADITISAPQPNDRPWAGYLYGSMGLTSVHDNFIDELEASLGVVGPLSGAEWVQKNWHSFVDARNPNGWHNQLENEPALQLTYQRRRPEYLVWSNDDWFASVDPYIGYALGNVYTYANTGVTARFGPGSARYQDLPSRVRPGTVGTGAFPPPPHVLSWYLFAGAEGRAVVRNIFLDGNTFADSASVEKDTLVGDVNAGAALTLGRVRLTYTAVARSREFKGQNKGDLFTSLSLGYRF